MKIKPLRIVVGALVRVTVFLTAIGGPAQQHFFDVRDGILMTRFNEPSGLANRERAQRSPNGRYFWLLTSRGLIDSNQIQSTLWLFNVSAIRRFLNTDQNDQISRPLPRVAVRISAVPRIQADDPYAPVISNVRWSSDSTTIFFLGENSRSEMQLYEEDVKAGSLRTLSPPGRSVRQFDVAGDTIAYTALPSNKGVLAASWDRTRWINEDALSVTGLSLGDILFPQATFVFGNGKVVPDLWVQRGGQFRKVDNPDQPKVELDTEHHENVLSLSPNGRMLVRLLPIHSVDLSWNLYSPKAGFESWRINPRDPSFTDSSNVFRLRQYDLTDTATGKTTVLIHGPSGDSLAESDRSQAVWSPTGSRLLLSNVALPLQGVDFDERARRRHSCAVAAIDLPSQRTTCIVFTRDTGQPFSNDFHPERLEEASFGDDNDHVVLRFGWNGKSHQTERYRFENGEWDLTSTLSGDSGGTSAEIHDSSRNTTTAVTLEVRQGLNDPPKLWAVDSVSGESKLLWNPNSTLDRMKFGRASPYQWKDKSGYAWSGILVLPPDYVAGRRYPLVIQTHGVPDDVFITDGKYSTAMAARPLASAGFVVLQMPYRNDHIATGREPIDQLAGYEGAVSQLSVEGLIDPHRVGIAGFSRTCWHVEHALIENPGLFAAATIADGVDMSYMQYMLFGEAYPIWAKAFEKVNEVKPIGPGLATWVERGPTFHLDRLETPLRIEAIGPPSILMEWQIYRSLRLQDKPVDMIYFPRGQHILQQPLDRLASQQSDVDWFRFWLEGYEDQDSSKAEQYRRWRAMRNLRMPN